MLSITRFVLSLIISFEMCGFKSQAKDETTALADTITTSATIAGVI